MGAMNLVIGNAMDQELQTATVSVSAPADDQLAESLVQLLSEVGIDMEVTETDAASVQSRAEAGDARLGIIIPEGFSQSVMNGEPSEIRMIEGEGAGIESDVVISVVKDRKSVV